MFQGPNVQYQNQKFCCEKDLEKGKMANSWEHAE